MVGELPRAARAPYPALVRFSPATVAGLRRDQWAVRRDLPVLLVVLGCVLGAAGVDQDALWLVGPVVATAGVMLAATRMLSGRSTSVRGTTMGLLVVVTVGVWWFVGSWPVAVDVVTG